MMMMNCESVYKVNFEGLLCMRSALWSSGHPVKKPKKDILPVRSLKVIVIFGEQGYQTTQRRCPLVMLVTRGFSFAVTYILAK